MSLAEKLRRFAVEAELYAGLMRPEKGEVRVAVRLTDSGEAATLVLGEKIEVVEGSEGPTWRSPWRGASSTRSRGERRTSGPS